MKAVVLAAGEGTRLWPFTYSQPKVMIPIANRPILEYVVEALVRSGVRDIVLVVGYCKERIMSHFSDGKEFGARIEYAFQRKMVEKAGTGYALSMARELVDDDFLVLAGDNIIDATTLTDIVHCKSRNALLVTESPTPSKYGVVQLAGSAVGNVIEKPEEQISNIISTGIYKLTATIFDEIDAAAKAGNHTLTAALQRLLAKEHVEGVFARGIWRDVVYPWDITSVNAEALSGLEQHLAGRIEKGAHIAGPVRLGEGCVVRAGAYIRGPVNLGENCEVMPGACIFPSTSIGMNVVIGPHAVIKESVIMSNSSIGAGAHISDAVIGQGVLISSNVGIEAGRAKVETEGELRDLERVGAMVGEETAIGAGCVLYSGVIVGARCRISPQVRVWRNIPDGTTVM
ncbi:MAG: bifunctional sugar-1-phosphate nucleotidylyltransferase/acetyltransferase [Candidatus Thermoplasmatota archaeon]